MLVLSRKRGEKICIGDDIVVVIIRAGRNVRLGIEAPPEVPVHRGEIWRAIQREKREGSD